jgi:hypothetical protein
MPQEPLPPFPDLDAGVSVDEPVYTEQEPAWLDLNHDMPRDVPPTPMSCQRQESFRVAAKTEQVTVDFLFIIDGSPAMNEARKVLSAQVPSFLQQLKSNHIDYRIGVTMMNPSSLNPPSGCLVGTTPVITPSTPNAVGELQRNIAKVTFPDFHGKGLAIIEHSLALALQGTACNKGFLRNGANLSIVLVSNQDDQSSGELSVFLDVLRSLRIKGYVPKVSAFVGPKGGCTTTGISATDAPRYRDFSSRFPYAGVQASICDLKGGMSQLSSFHKVIGTLPTTRFPLKEMPIASTIEVTFGGGLVAKERYAYDVAANAIVFTEPALFDVGTDFKVSYDVPATRTDRFKQKDVNHKVDFLLVLDNSASMGDEQTALGKQAIALLDALDRRNIDYQIGVTTMDVGGPSGAKGCFVGKTKILTPATPNVALVLQSLLQVGTHGHPKQQGFRAAALALGPRLKEANCNKGFLRDDAELAILFVSDTDELSTQTPEEFMAIVKGLKKQGFPVRVSSLAAPVGGCQSGTSNGFEAKRYMAVTNALGGHFQSICQLTNALVNVAAVSGGTLDDSFALSAEPRAPKSILVKVNGKDAAGWRYTALSNSIVFPKGSEPPKQASVDVTYGLVCGP